MSDHLPQIPNEVKGAIATGIFGSIGLWWKAGQDKRKEKTDEQQVRIQILLDGYSDREQEDRERRAEYREEIEGYRKTIADLHSVIDTQQTQIVLLTTKIEQTEAALNIAAEAAASDKRKDAIIETQGVHIQELQKELGFHRSTYLHEADIRSEGAVTEAMMEVVMADPFPMPKGDQ